MSRSPRVLKVIETQIPRGDGTERNLTRLVTQYHTLKGKFLAEHDPCTKAPDFMDHTRKPPFPGRKD